MLNRLLALAELYNLSLEETTNHYILKNYYGNIIIKKVTKENSWRYPRFIYKNVKYHINNLILIILEESLRQYDLQVNNNFHIQAAVNRLMSFALQDKSKPYSRPVRKNNELKLTYKYKFIKHWYYDRESKELRTLPTLESAIIANLKFSAKEIESILSKMKIDLCKVDSINDSIIVSLPKNEDFEASCYGTNSESIYTLFENSPNIPARLTQAVTSDGILPSYDKCTPNFFVRSLDSNITNGNSKDGGINSVIAFVPAVHENLFLCGEIYSNRTFAENKVMFERNITLPFPIEALEIVKIGSEVLQFKQFAKLKDEYYLDITQRRFLMTLPYQSGKLISVRQQKEDKIDENGNVVPDVNYTTFTFYIESKVGSARVISEHGIKGFTIPMNNIGYIKTKFGKVLPDLIVGPNAIKAKFNTIRAATYALHCHISSNIDKLRPTSDKDAIEIVDKVNSAKLIEGVWHGPFGPIACYLGVEHVVVTSLSNDYKFRGVKIAPEALRFMHIAGNKKLVKELIENYVDEENGELLHEVLTILNNQKHHVNFELTENTLHKLRQFPVDIRILTDGDISVSGLLDPKNSGFSISFYGAMIRFPSYKLCQAFITTDKSKTYYPQFFKYANLLIRNLQTNVQPNTIKANYEKYLKELRNLLLSKSGLIAKSCSVEVEGGYLVQLPCHLVPEGVSVLPHPWYESKYGPFEKYPQGDIWDIGCRNPVLWMSMLQSRRIWTYSEFKDYLQRRNIDINIFATQFMKGCILRNPDDCMKDQSDSDGDLYPVTVPKKVQALCRPIDYTTDSEDLIDQIFMYKWSSENDTIKRERLEGYFHQPIIIDFQKQWIKNYKNNEIKVLEPKPFFLTKIPRELYNSYYISGAIAKADVAFSTVSLWEFNTAIEILMERGEILPTESLTLMAIYSSLLQDYVIRGIKHSLNTSKDFHMFLVKNIESERDIITQFLIEMNCSKKTIDHFFQVAALANTPEVSTFSLLPNGSSSNMDAIFNGINSIINKQPLIKENVVCKQILEHVI